MARSIRLLASGFGALEGPVVDEAGNLYVGDLVTGGVHRVDAEGRTTDVLVPGRLSVGGICLHADGGLVVSGPDLSHIRDGESRVILSLDDVPSKPGTRAVAFNDIHADGAGAILAGVLRRDDRDEFVPGELLRVTAARTYDVFETDVHPNGMALSADGARVYAADTFRRRLVVYAVATDGLPERVAEVSTADVPGLPDGLATDEDGFVWVAFYQGSRVARLAPDGTLVETIEMPVLKPLSVCFGGPDRTDLYVVTGRDKPAGDETGSIFVVPAGVRGVAVGVARI